MQKITKLIFQIVLALSHAPHRYRNSLKMEIIIILFGLMPNMIGNLSTAQCDAPTAYTPSHCERLKCELSSVAARHQQIAPECKSARCSGGFNVASPYE